MSLKGRPATGPGRAARDPAFSALILAWYDRHRRDLPWRAPPGGASDPYGVWLSEIMLQQTTVAAVKPYYALFRTLWPDVESLAAAPLDAVLKAWAGLGYYSRARNLHACAQEVMARHGGRFPETEAELRDLPGIGAYTAAAIAAIAFGRRAVVVDGNVERVMARVHAIETPLPQARPALRDAMDRVTPERRCGDFAQAVMDIGATVCTPRSPTCVICPLRAVCLAAAAGRASELPRKAAKRAVPTRGGAVFFVQREDGCILVRTRPPHGLFGGMMELPGTDWSEGFSVSLAMPLPRGIGGPLEALGTVQHGLTHFTLILHVFAASLSGEPLVDGAWMPPDAIAGLPTLMRKVVELALDQSRETDMTSGQELLIAAHHEEISKP